MAAAFGRGAIGVAWRAVRMSQSGCDQAMECHYACDDLLTSVVCKSSDINHRHRVMDHLSPNQSRMLRSVPTTRLAPLSVRHVPASPEIAPHGMRASANALRIMAETSGCGGWPKCREIANEHRVDSFHRRCWYRLDCLRALDLRDDARLSFNCGSSRGERRSRPRSPSSLPLS